MPRPGSAFPIVEAKKDVTPVATKGKYSALAGNYDVDPMGMLVVRQEGEKLYAVPPNGQTVEFVPDATVDKFAAQAVGALVRF